MVDLPEEEIQVLAFRLYKLNETYDHCIWRLAELCKIIELNVDVKGDNWCDLNAFKTVEDIKNNLKTKKIVYPTAEQIRPLAEKLYNYQPEKSKLHWYIAEKMLVFKKIKEWLGE